MKFTTDPDDARVRAWSVQALLPRDPSIKLTRNQTRVKITTPVDPDEPTVFDAFRGEIGWQDMDGERRTIDLPDGITAEAVAAILYSLAHVEEWS